MKTVQTEHSAYKLWSSWGRFRSMARCSMEEELIQKELEKAAVDAVERLRGPDKLLIYGRAYGKTYEELGKLTGKSPCTVKNRVRWLRAVLQQSLLKAP